MCGIAGIVSSRPDPSLGEKLDRMIAIQAHRGPDGRGAWTGCVSGVHLGLASARLAILDLSDAGLQPLLSPSGRQVLVYNGEIYNYRELRAELQGLGAQFHTQCDTEVVQDRVTGFLVPPRDTVALAEVLEQLVTSRELRDTMGAAGRGFVLEHYAWDATARIVEDLYDRILNAHPHPTR